MRLDSAIAYCAGIAGVALAIGFAAGTIVLQLLGGLMGLPL